MLPIEFTVLPRVIFHPHFIAVRHHVIRSFNNHMEIYKTFLCFKWVYVSKVVQTVNKQFIEILVDHCFWKKMWTFLNVYHFQNNHVFCVVQWKTCPIIRYRHHVFLFTGLCETTGLVFNCYTRWLIAPVIVERSFRTTVMSSIFLLRECFEYLTWDRKVQYEAKKIQWKVKL